MVKSLVIVLTNDSNSSSADESIVAPPYSPIVYDNENDVMDDDSGMKLYKYIIIMYYNTLMQ